MMSHWRIIAYEDKKIHPLFRNHAALKCAIQKMQCNIKDAHGCHSFGLFDILFAERLKSKNRRKIIYHIDYRHNL